MSMPCRKCDNETYREDRYECPCEEDRLVERQREEARDEARAEEYSKTARQQELQELEADVKEGREFLKARDKLFEEMVRTLKRLQSWECQTRCYFPASGDGKTKVHLITCKKLKAILAEIEAAK